MATLGKTSPAQFSAVPMSVPVAAGPPSQVMVAAWLFVAKATTRENRNDDEPVPNRVGLRDFIARVGRFDEVILGWG